MRDHSPKCQGLYGTNDFTQHKNLIKNEKIKWNEERLLFFGKQKTERS